MTWHIGRFIWEDPQFDAIFLLGLALMFVLRNHLQWRTMLMASSFTYLAGTLLNGVVVVANGLQMPVVGIFKATPGDYAHIPATSHTTFNWLGDWIQSSVGIASPGDMLVWAGVLAVVLTLCVQLVYRLKRS